MNMLSGAGASRLGGVGGSSSSDSSSSSSVSFSSNSLLFTAKTVQIKRTKHFELCNNTTWKRRHEFRRTLSSSGGVVGSYTKPCQHYILQRCRRVRYSLPGMGVSSSSGCADISIATPPSRLDLFRLMETWRLSDSMALTVNSVASKADSTGMPWPEESYWLGCLPPPCSDQEQSTNCSH